MATLERRLAILEKGDPPPVVRAPDEPFETFRDRMLDAVASVPDGAGTDAQLAAMRPWLEAMTHVELRELRDAIEADIRARPDVPASTLYRGNR